jgi:hypothetical protein
MNVHVCFLCCRRAARGGMDNPYVVPRSSRPGHLCGRADRVHLLSSEQGLPGKNAYGLYWQLHRSTECHVVRTKPVAVSIVCISHSLLTTVP